MMRGLISQVCVLSILLQGFYLIQAEETIGRSYICLKLQLFLKDQL